MKKAIGWSQKTKLFSLVFVVVMGSSAWAYIEEPNSTCSNGVRACSKNIGGVKYTWSCNCPPSTPNEMCAYDYIASKSVFIAMCVSNPGPTERVVPHN